MIAAARGITTILSVMKTYLSNVTNIQECGCEALGSLALNKDKNEMIANAGGKLGLLCEIMHSIKVFKKKVMDHFAY